MSFRAVTRYPEIPAKAGTRKRHFTGPRIECGVTRCAPGVVRSVGTYRAAMRYPGRAGRGLPKCPRRESDKMAPTAKIRHENGGWSDRRSPPLFFTYRAETLHCGHSNFLIALMLFYDYTKNTPTGTTFLSGQFFSITTEVLTQRSIILFRPVCRPGRGHPIRLCSVSVSQRC